MVKAMHRKAMHDRERRVNERSPAVGRCFFRQPSLHRARPRTAAVFACCLFGVRALPHSQFFLHLPQIMRTRLRCGRGFRRSRGFVGNGCAWGHLVKRSSIGVATRTIHKPAIRNSTVWADHLNGQIEKTKALAHQPTKFIGVKCQAKNVGSKENGLRASHIKWLIEVAGLKVKEAANLMGCSYATAYAVAQYRTRALDEPIKPDWWDAGVRS